jgi:putative FmdB family regulatory protein
MPIYPYECDECLNEFEVAKRVSQIDDEEECPKCESFETRRTIAKQQSFYGADQWDCMAYDPAFGQVVKDNNHRKRLARERGLVEVGTESPDKMHKHYEAQREKEIADRWDKV